VNEHTPASKLDWEAPATVALTEAGSRADESDVSVRNLTAISPS
jgi:hypothetical protein